MAQGDHGVDPGSASSRNVRSRHGDGEHEQNGTDQSDGITRFNPIQLAAQEARERQRSEQATRRTYHSEFCGLFEHQSQDILRSGAQSDADPHLMCALAH